MFSSALESVRETMESLHEDAILEFHPDTLEAVRKLYNLEKPGRMAEAIDILEDWIKKQEHFTTKEFSRGYLERLIIRNKGSLERAKASLDKLCTLKTLVPQFFEVINIKALGKEYEHIKEVLMPKLTSENHRVVVSKNTGKEFPDNILLKNGIKSAVMWEYILKYDYNAGLIIVIDLTECNIISLVTKMELNVTRQAAEVFEGYSMRLKAVHIITNSKAVEAYVAILKQVLKKKLSERIHVHSNVDSLKTAMEVDVLPVEYGGKGKSVNELNEKWLDVLSSKEHMDYLRIMYEAKTDESKRKLDKFNEQYLGAAGTFRTMVVD